MTRKPSFIHKLFSEFKTSANGVCINDINTLRLAKDMNETRKTLSSRTALCRGAVGEISVCAGIAMGQDVVIPLSR
jgi:hypothetical protein